MLIGGQLLYKVWSCNDSRKQDHSDDVYVDLLCYRLAEQCLAYHPEHVNVVGSDGFTGLHSATVFNDTAIINLLASQVR